MKNNDYMEVNKILLVEWTTWTAELKYLKEFRLDWESNPDLCNDTMQCSIHWAYQANWRAGQFFWSP